MFSVRNKSIDKELQICVISHYLKRVTDFNRFVGISEEWLVVSVPMVAVSISASSRILLSAKIVTLDTLFIISRLIN